MKQLSHIPLVQSLGGQMLPSNLFSNVVLSSAHTNWRNIVVEEHHFSTREMGDLMFVQDVIAVNIGCTVRCEFKKDGRFQQLAMGKHAVSLSPGARPFFRRSQLDENGSGEVLYMAVDPGFVSRTAESLDVYPDRLELIEQQRPADPALWHIAMALRAGLQGTGIESRLYGESLSTALVAHLLRQYAGRPVGPPPHRGLPREKLTRAIEYIQDQLHADLTVADVAQAIHMSPYHFTRLFKQSTGRSPYRYVIEARAKKARDLLLAGQFSIVEIAHNLGFADQSHLTRQVKEVFGVTPRVLLERG